MAKPRSFSGQNRIFKAPPGHEKTIVSLPVHFTGSEIISCWVLSEEERAKVAQSGLVWLSVMGQTLAPVLVSGTPLMYHHDAAGNDLGYDPDIMLAESILHAEEADWRGRFIAQLAGLIHIRDGGNISDLEVKCVPISGAAWDMRNPDMTPEQTAEAEYAAMFAQGTA